MISSAPSSGFHPFLVQLLFEKQKPNFENVLAFFLETRIISAYKKISILVGLCYSLIQALLKSNLINEHPVKWHAPWNMMTWPTGHSPWQPALDLGQFASFWRLSFSVIPFSLWPVIVVPVLFLFVSLEFRYSWSLLTPLCSWSPPRYCHWLRTELHIHT